jgi:hypothetical protein
MPCEAPPQTDKSWQHEAPELSKFDRRSLDGVKRDRRYKAGCTPWITPGTDSGQIAT